MEKIRVLLTDPATGETSDETLVRLEDGDQVVTAEQRALRREFAEMERERNLRRSWFSESQEELGPFVFAIFDRNKGPQHVLKEGAYARLAYLATFLNYDQVLAKTQKTTMTKKDAKRALGLSKSEFYRFWEEVTAAKCITEDEDGTLHLPKRLFRKGKVLAKGYHIGFAKVFINQMRKLYQSIPTTSHRYLGAVFEMLPYISVKFNALCYNPLETDVDRVRPMTMTEFCVLTGRNKSDATRLRREYQEISFTMQDGVTRWFCAFVRSHVGWQDEQEIIIINPRVLFAGEDWRYVETYIMHFPEKSSVGSQKTE